MGTEPSQLPFDYDGPNALAIAPLPPGELFPDPNSQERPPKRRKPVTEILLITSGAFLVVWIFTWVMTTYVFVEKPADETSMELPKTRIESAMLEIPVAKIRQEKDLPRLEGKGPPMVFIVEIDAAIMVHGKDAELLVLDKMIRSHHHRIEGAIDCIIRSATPAELAEPDSQILRTRIRDQINSFYGYKLAREVLFSHFRAFHTPIKR